MIIQSKAKPAGREGFGLPTAVMSIVVFSALALLGIALARHEVRRQVDITSQSRAFYAAETGLARGLENWNRPDILGRGDSWIVDQGSLPGVGQYTVRATKLDDGSTVQPVFSIESEGRAPIGRTQVAALLATTVPLGSPVRGALKAKGRVRVVGQSDVDGWDSVPAPWNVACPAAAGGMTGVVMSDTSKVSKQGAATVEGNPPIDELADTTGWFDFGSFSYQAVTGMADITLPGGTNVSSGPAPSYLVDGSCDTSDNYNWGDPDNPTLPCGDWFPIIHATGDLTAAGGGSGQGILLVDGDFSACGGFTFYGVIVALGEVKSCGSGFKLVGGVVSGETELTHSGGMVAGSNRIQFSACAVERALSRGKAARPEPLNERPWYSNR